MKNSQHYISEAEYIPDLKLDMAFIVRDDFYYGDENDFTQEEWIAKREPLLKPGIPLFGKNYLLSSEVLGKEEQLQAYYESVVAVANKYEKKLLAGNSYFWIRPIVYSSDGGTINFPWYDTLTDALPFLNALQGKEEGCVFSDMDQGWHLDVFLDKENICFVFGSLDDPEPYWVVSTNRPVMAKSVEDIKQRVKQQIAALSPSFGYDFWTEREALDFTEMDNNTLS